ncbi:MAG: PepSY domain-containing protein, partial [Acetobacteraceae bacterium]
MLATGGFALLLATGPAVAWAHGEGPDPFTEWLQEEGPGPAALQALSGAKVSLQQAVVTAQQKTGDRAFVAKIENDNGAIVYWIATVANGGSVTHLRVDPVTGAVLVSPGVAIVGPELQQDASLAAGTKLSLVGAIQAA